MAEECLYVSPTFPLRFYQLYPVTTFEVSINFCPNLAIKSAENVPPIVALRWPKNIVEIWEDSEYGKTDVLFDRDEIVRYLFVI